MSKNTLLNEIINSFDSLLYAAELDSPLITDKQVQIDRVDNLMQTLKIVKEHKRQEVLNKNEDIANLFLYYQCAFNLKISHLNMCLSIKIGEPHTAWNYLIDTQEYFQYALRAFRVSGFASDSAIESLLEYKKKLLAVEDVIFHRYPVYLSCGFRTKEGTCSICAQPIDSCEHIEEYVYMGRICKRILTENNYVAIDEISLVTNPKDRRCIITYYHKEDTCIDYITRKKLPKKKDASTDRVFGGIANSKTQLDIF